MTRTNSPVFKRIRVQIKTFEKSPQSFYMVKFARLLTSRTLYYNQVPCPGFLLEFGPSYSGHALAMQVHLFRYEE